MTPVHVQKDMWPCLIHVSPTPTPIPPDPGRLAGVKEEPSCYPWETGIHTPLSILVKILLRIVEPVGDRGDQELPHHCRGRLVSVFT